MIAALILIVYGGGALIVAAVLAVAGWRDGATLRRMQRGKAVRHAR